MFSKKENPKYSFHCLYKTLLIKNFSDKTFSISSSPLLLGSGNTESIRDLIAIIRQNFQHKPISIIASPHIINDLKGKDCKNLNLIEYPHFGILNWNIDDNWWREIMNQNFDSIFFNVCQNNLYSVRNIIRIIYCSKRIINISFIDTNKSKYSLTRNNCATIMKSIETIDMLSNVNFQKKTENSFFNENKRLLFDCRILSEKTQTGVHRYTREMINLFPAVITDVKIQSIGCETIILSDRVDHLPITLPLSDHEGADNLLTITSNLEKSDLIFSPYYPIPKRRNAKAVLTIHDLIPLVHPEWFSNPNTYKFFDQSLRESALHVDKIIADSNSTKQDIINIYGVDESKIEVIHLAPNSIFFPSDQNSQSEESFEISHGRPYFLSVCTQEPRKNLVGVIKAYDLLRKQNPSLDPALVLVGKKGWKNDELERTLKESNFKDSIFITGYIEDNTLVNAYREAIAFIYPSFYEGFGLPVLEAMSCGTPVITSNNSSLPEIGKDSVLYCDPSSLEDISSAMERVSTDSLLREKLINMGLRRAEYFSWKKTAQKTAQVISSLLN